MIRLDQAGPIRLETCANTHILYGIIPHAAYVLVQGVLYKLDNC